MKVWQLYSVHVLQQLPRKLNERSKCTHAHVHMHKNMHTRTRTLTLTHLHTECDICIHAYTHYSRRLLCSIIKNLRFVLVEWIKSRKRMHGRPLHRKYILRIQESTEFLAKPNNVKVNDSASFEIDVKQTILFVICQF